NWEDLAKKGVHTWPPNPQARDKKLTHMTTHHQDALSYLTFGELWKIISHEDNWPLFDKYFPPQDNAETKIEEIITIRNRVAHFREPHLRDDARFKLFLQDMNPGIRRFCDRYSSCHQIENDPIAKRLEEKWDGIGYGYEMRLPDGKWAYAPGNHRLKPL